MISELRKFQTYGHPSGLHLGFCSRGGKIAVSAYQGGGGKRYMLYITIYIVKSQGGGGENAPCAPLNATLPLFPEGSITLRFYYKIHYGGINSHISSKW